MRIALAQMNATVGDLAGNVARIEELIGLARDLEADLIAFPELALTGYPPEDLLLKPAFVRANLRYLERVVAASQGIAVVCGFVDLDIDIYNAAAFAYDGRLLGTYHKVHLPNYGVFDEERYFRRGTRCPIFTYRGVRLGISICEDGWFPNGPIAVQAQHGVDLVLNINGSPFHRGKRALREAMFSTRAVDARAFLAFVNLVGGQDELVFDGNSVVFDPAGKVQARAASFDEDLLVADLQIDAVLGGRLRDLPLRQQLEEEPLINLEVSEIEVPSAPPAGSRKPLQRANAQALEGPAEVYAALVAGTRDYVRKNHFDKVVIGLSGGVDSSLTAAIAADALGGDRVVGVLMPSRYSSPESLADATELAQALGIATHSVPIDVARQAFDQILGDAFRGTEPGLAEENLQARIRGNILMALSNKFGWLVFSTGNKSELATGYCTLYGDMAGGFAVIKDVPKTVVYELCRFRNARAGQAVIPPQVLEKAPSAELRPNQKDQDDLPPYEALDPILTGYVEDDLSFEDLVAAGHPAELVERVIGLVDRSEYKRRQAAPGVKITPRAFGRDRRMPITNRYRQGRPPEAG